MELTPSLLDARASQELLLEATSDAIFSVDFVSGLIVGANSRLEAITGISMVELLGGPARLLTPDVSDPRETSFGPEVYGYPGLHEDVLVARSDGYVARVTIRVAHVQTESRDVAVCVARDETERRMLQRELITKHVALQDAHRELSRRVSELAELSETLESRNAELAALSARMSTTQRRAMLGEVVAEVAHSMNNPLGALSSSLRMLGRFECELAEAAQPRYGKILGRCVIAADRMARVVDELHVACRTGSVRDHSETVSVGEEVDAAMSLLAHRIPVGVRVELDLDRDVYAHASAADVHHAVLNLVDNAVFAVGDEGRVRISCVAQEQWAQIVVSDSGPGIADDYRENVFEPFFTTKARGQGTGLGLSMVRRMANRFGGSIQLQGEGPLGGASFTVRLPRLVAPRKTCLPGGPDV